MPALPERNDAVRDAMHLACEHACNSEPRRAYLGCSILGHPCDRHLWFSFRQFPRKVIEGRVAMLFQLGHLIEDEVIRWMKTAGYRIDGRQDAFTAFDGYLAGHCDGVVTHPSLGQREHILEIKSASKTSFEKFAAHGIHAEPKYAAQVQLYMGLGGYERALFVVYCKDNSDIYSERVRFDRGEFQQLMARAERIITTNDLPDAVEEYFTCKFCDFSTLCKGAPVMANNVNCASCKFHRFHGLKRACHHPAHPYWLPVFTGCPDYLIFTEMHDPALGQTWPDPVADDVVREYAG